MNVPQPQGWVAETEARQTDSIRNGLILLLPWLGKGWGKLGKCQMDGRKVKQHLLLGWDQFKYH